MKVNKRVMSLIVTGGLLLGSIPFNVFADSVNVVTIGANLSEAQREKMFEFFGTNEDEVMVIEVTNEDEKKYLGNVMSEEQIGNKTFSCSYVEPTTEGGINVKTVNLTYVTSAIITSTLITSGIEASNILCYSPIPASGTGALSGILMAYEKSSGESLDEEKKELATEELITTGDLGEDIGQEKAAGVINDIKTEIIKNNTQDTNQIAETITNVTNNYNITLTPSQTEVVQGLMERVAKQDYDYDAIKGTLDTVTENVDKGLEQLGEKVKRGNFFENLMSSIQGLFESKKEEVKDLGILANTKDEVLGDNVIVDATDDSIVINKEALKQEAHGFIDKVANWINRLLDATKTNNQEEAQTNEDIDITTETDTEIESTESNLEVESGENNDTDASVSEESIGSINSIQTEQNDSINEDTVSNIVE